MKTVLASRRSALIAVAVFSAVVNLLFLTGPLFMLQVYDRVLSSHSIPTLVALLVLVTILFSYFVVLEIIRGRILARIGMAIEEVLARRLFSISLKLPLQNHQPGQRADPLRDLNTLRQFFASTGPVAIFDMPWLPLYLGLVYLLHPLLGLTATAGAVVLVGLTLMNEGTTRRRLIRATQHYADSHAIAHAGQRNAEAVYAMGMEQALSDRWLASRQAFITSQTEANDVSSGFGSVIKGLRLFLQSLILAMGAYLAIGQLVSPGVMIAASIIAARALAPVELAVSNWRNYVDTSTAWRRLEDVLALQVVQVDRLELPPPQEKLEITDLGLTPPGAVEPVLSGVTFSLEAGQGLCVVGPSAAGKSSLARGLTGIWTPTEGSVRLDSATLSMWQNCTLGRHIGYLPQTVELLEGSVKQNISRFDPDADPKTIITAARIAGVHDVILGLPDGYDTEIGENGHALSAGQRQRLGLARAMFADPFLIVLDEPNSNLDATGQHALVEAIRTARQRGSIVIVMTHRPSIAAACDMALMLACGRQTAFGRCDDILARAPRRSQRAVA